MKRTIHQKDTENVTTGTTVSRRLQKYLITNVVETDWEAATQTWMKLKQVRSQITTQTLLDQQLALWEFCKKNSALMIGQPLLVISDRVSEIFYPDYPYRTKILSIEFFDTIPQFTCLFEPIRGEKEKTEKVALYRVLPLIELPAAPQELQEDARLAPMIEKINRQKNSTLINTKNLIERYTDAITQKKREITAYQIDLKKNEEKLEGLTEVRVGVDDIKEMIDSILKHVHVSSAFLATNGKVIVETDMLYATDPKTMVADKTKPIGRFALLLNSSGNELYAMNMNYSVDNFYDHPNILDDEICLGNIATKVHDLLGEGKYYELVDLLIVFLSLFPHDSGMPHMGHFRWLEERVAREEPNPWKDECVAYAGKRSNKAKRVFRKKTQVVPEATIPVVTPKRGRGRPRKVVVPVDLDTDGTLKIELPDLDNEFPF